MPAETVVVGRVGRPHGLDGAFVVEEASDDPGRFEVGTTVLLEGEPAVVVERKRAGGRLILRLDRPAARGAALQIRQEQLPQPSDDEYYVFQLLGLDVVEEGGRDLGRVQEVVPAPANDVLELDSGHALPMVEECILKVDLDARRILVARGFASPE